MNKKPLSLKLKQKVYNIKCWLHYEIESLVWNSNSHLWCEIGIHKDVATVFGDFKCERCGRWAE